MDDALDDDRLFAVILDGARQDFAAIFERLAGERVYAVALYTSQDLVYVCATVRTEEGLDLAVRRAGERAPPDSRETRVLELRDSSCDSPHHGWTGDLAGLSAATRLLQQRHEAVSALADQADADGGDGLGICVAWSLRTTNVMEAVLRTLGDEGRFGVEDSREHIHVNIEMGDQSFEERLAFSARLNPESVHARYARHVASVEAHIERCRRERAGN